MSTPAYPVTAENGGTATNGLTKLEYAAIRIAAGIRASAMSDTFTTDDIRHEPQATRRDSHLRSQSFRSY